MVTILAEEDNKSLENYMNMYTDVLQRINLFIMKLNETGQNYRTKKFLVNMAIKTTFDSSMTENDKVTIYGILEKTEEMFNEFKKNNQVLHVQIANEKLNTNQYEKNIIKYYISIIRRFVTYISINSRNIDNYDFAVNQSISYLNNISFCIDIFGNLKQ
jgi:hypothetical protein